MKRLFTFLGLCLIPLPVLAHGAALVLMGKQVMLYIALLVLTPVLAVPGRRLLSFVVVLLAYPAAFFLVAIAMYQFFPDSSKADQAWEYAMFLVWALSILTLIRLRIIHKSNQVAQSDSTQNN